MTLWELAACIAGVNYANDPERHSNKLDAPTEEEFEQMLIDYDHLRGTAH